MHGFVFFCCRRRCSSSFVWVCWRWSRRKGFGSRWRTHGRTEAALGKSERRLIEASGFADVEGTGGNQDPVRLRDQYISWDASGCKKTRVD